MTAIYNYSIISNRTNTKSNKTKQIKLSSYDAVENPQLLWFNVNTMLSIPSIIESLITDDTDIINDDRSEG